MPTFLQSIEVSVQNLCSQLQAIAFVTSLVAGRICVVNNDGGVLIDQYVQPQEKVTDYRTFVSGIEPKHLKDGAVSLSKAQKMVAQILTGRILVGHSVHHDLKVRCLPLFVICCWACISLQ